MTSKLYLTKRRNGYYYIGFFEGNHRRWRTTKCTVKSDALQFLRNFEGTKKEMERTPLLSTLFTRFESVKQFPTLLGLGQWMAYERIMVAIPHACASGSKNLRSWIDPHRILNSVVIPERDQDSGIITAQRLARSLRCCASSKLHPGA